MKPFQYATATSAASARELLGDNGAYLAGGNDLLGLMKEQILNPAILVNIKSLPGFGVIQPGRKVWTVGGGVRIADLEDHAELTKLFPGVQQAAAEVGSRQIRNLATLGGNLSQHSRCWYYRQRDVLCLKKGGDTCYARHGENKYHSLFTGNTCISPLVSNLAVAMSALSATAIVLRGTKQLPMTIPELYARAWDNPTAHNSLDPGDLILQVDIPVQGRRSAYLQISERAAFDWALVSCAAAGRIEAGKITHASVVLGAVSPVPYESIAANRFLEGKTLDDETAGKAADLVLEKAHAQAHNGYKVAIVRALVRRTLMQLTA
jgi:xanthine dehydrogenase YagS FAD-binding subunit